MNKQCIAEATISTVSGYNHNNVSALSLEGFSSLLQQMQNDYYKSTKEYISWNVIPAKTIYSCEYGCPVGGECVFILQTSYTKKYDDRIDIDTWKDIITNNIKYIKEKLNQCTVRVHFIEADVIILE